MISAQWLVRKCITYVLLSNYNKARCSLSEKMYKSCIADSLIVVSPGVSRVLKMAFHFIIYLKLF